MRHGSHASPSTPGTQAPRPPAKVVAARELLGPAGVVRIEHQGEHYQLRLTRAGKLILTK